MVNEEDVQGSRVLVMEFTCSYRYRVPMRPGMGGNGDAVIDAVQRAMNGQPNIDPSSIRFYIQGEESP